MTSTLGLVRPVTTGIARVFERPVASSGSSAVGPEAAKVNLQLSYSESDRMSSRYLGDRLFNLLAELEQMAATRTAPSADDQPDARPDPRSLHFAVTLLWSLPMVDLPNEINVDADGEIAFDWSDDEDRAFALSISPAGVLAYGGLYCDEAISGRVALAGGSVPSEILDGIHRAH